MRKRLITCPLSFVLPQARAKSHAKSIGKLFHPSSLYYFQRLEFLTGDSDDAHRIQRCSMSPALSVWIAQFLTDFQVITGPCSSSWPSYFVHKVNPPWRPFQSITCVQHVMATGRFTESGGCTVNWTTLRPAGKVDFMSIENTSVVWLQQALESHSMLIQVSSQRTENPALLICRDYGLFSESAIKSSFQR